MRQGVVVVFFLFFFLFVLAQTKMSLEFNFLNHQSLTSHRAVIEPPQRPRRRKKKKRASYLMKSVEVRYSSSSRMDEIEPLRDDYICRWEINFNVQLSFPYEQLDSRRWNLARPSRSLPTARRCFQLVPIFSSVLPVSRLASHTGASDCYPALTADL